ncbi:hypothetical protein ACSMXN_08195 [Jatrophihabitans sp. DSM 45814]
MVTSGASSPAEFTQRQVDDLARGNHEHLAAIRRTPTREVPPDGIAGARPAALSAKEIEAIRRAGHPSAAVAKRIGTTERPQPTRAARPRKGANVPTSRRGGKGSSSPELRPPP